MRLERSCAAERDLDDLLTFGTARFDEAVADEYPFSFDDAFALILDYLRIGEAIDAIEPGVRVLRILHHAVDVDEHL
ncbi:MAG: hypothetical protein WC804_21075 [Sphingomonas sp.]|jgi:plasmid stabilization system protein ParE|uniref:hypothetical protein n=1 Tax=Sphingomonas sp. TaxID=28214 RepID=UPI00356806A1